MTESKKVKSALLTKAELIWLSGNNVNISKSYEYKMKSNIRSKLKIFTNLEFPIIQKSSIFTDDLTLFGKDLTTYSKADSPLNSSNLQIPSQNIVGREGFEPSNPAMSRRYLNQARPPARFICYMCQALKFCPVDRSNNFILAIIKVII